ncbi:Ribonucleases P/MRP protein subunit pop1 [Phytophthora pseudosyringae]|uniref:Ribonucleases P/MRP protein subunit pop1 n=1 Tax=Phytophthora pseudosyringae TaxID=221518 RepID=A0A8T1VS16_9STRA|nr:Ribonucleases P/MRP protein subunit pop1 [Phytophthora pseudosyringae]
MAGLGPRVLQVLEFANARAPELQALHELSRHEAVSSATDVKLAAQKNQRRRRANAFKSHKMPLRLRATPKSSGQSAARCRKHERRPHKLLQDRSDAADERPRWLSTHLWHAKRMTMSEQHGYMLALHRADKSVSAALQAVRKMATLHDVSYYGVMELFGLPQVILEALQLVSDPNGSDFHGLRFLAGTEEGTSMLYHDGQFPQGAIAPVTFMWRPLQKDYEGGDFELHKDWQSTKRQLWLWVHPAAYMEAATAIAAACQEVVGEADEGIEMHDRRGNLCRLKLRGRLADELAASLTAGDEEIGEDMQEEEDGSDHEDGFNEKETVAICCGGNRRNMLRALRKTGKKSHIEEEKEAVFSVAIKDPRLARCREGKLRHLCAPPKTGFSLLNEPPADVVSKMGTSVIESPLSGQSLSSLGKDAEEPEVKVIMKEMQTLLAWTTSSSSENSGEYPHIIAGGVQAEMEVEDDSAMEMETSPSSLLWSLSKRRKLENNFLKDHQLNEEVYRQRKDGALADGIDGVRVKSPPLHLLVIKKRGSYPHTSGWDLICSPASAPGLLKALVFGGALVVGLEEDGALSTVLHQPSFPCDYPDTQAGQAYWKTRADNFENDQAKKPKSKRFNYEKRGVKSPFQPRWGLLFDGQYSEGDAEEENTQTPCVLRGETYMEPFCFYRASRTEGSKAIASPEVDADSIVPVPIPTLVRIVVVVPRRGNIDVNAMLFAPSAEDVEQYRNDKNWKGYDIDVGKKSTAGTSKGDERSLIGYVTSAIYDRPKGAFRAIGFIACEPLQQLFLASRGQKYGKQDHRALAMLRSPKGRVVRPVLVQAEA